MMRSLTFMIGFLVIGGMLWPSFVVLAGSEMYVDEDADSGGDGSKDEPYKKIEKALDKGGTKIRIAKGSYDEDITVGKGVQLKGSGRSDVTIKGKVTMKDGSKLEDLTVSGGGVVLSDGANASLSDVSVKNAGTGIITKGRGKLKMKDVKVRGNGKGLYIQRGKDIEIIGCEVTDNGEEGIDIRANVDGVISGNLISGNHESGIEVILGDSELKISNNNIKNNRASGIAAQYYKSAKKLGGLKITGNKINSNKDYGLTCKAPSGGNPGEAYWSESMVLIGNAMSGNKQGAFAPGCFFAQDKEEDAVMTEEEKEKKLLATEEEAALAVELLKEKKAVAEELEAIERLPKRYSYVQTKEKKRILEVQYQNLSIAKRVAEIAQEIHVSHTSVDQAVNMLASEKKIKIYYMGRNSQTVAILMEEIHTNEERINELRTIEASMEVLTEASMKNLVAIAQTRKILEEGQIYNQEQKETFDAIGDPIARLKWLFNL